MKLRAISGVRAAVVGRTRNGGGVARGVVQLVRVAHLVLWLLVWRYLPGQVHGRLATGVRRSVRLCRGSIGGRWGEAGRFNVRASR